MSNLVKILLLAISILMVAVIVAGCSSGFVPQREEGVYSASPSSAAFFNGPTNGQLQSSTAGGVTVDVEWNKTEDGFLVFSVAMDTHSVDLDRYDLKESALLRDDTDSQYYPVSWDSAPGGHHRTGTLTFPVPDSLSQGKAKYIEMVIRDVGGIEERVLKWEL